MNPFLRDELVAILREELAVDGASAGRSGMSDSGALASVVNLAAIQIDAALPTIRAGAEALGNTDLSRTMWMVAHLLEGLHEKLEAAEMEG
ncbi:hypothetical protein H9L17_03370 [Thermomonas brevis]|uniref:Uncharacterized protein n=1 Tax=Thermomonas brevis TaxID=215691 RepID=A0A7G9QV31_9GAMM|nr:hypothetical protein [Thermomonas brevis]QNN47206.1 hypothetical protein H9L17_03370 [Thermomonas brevis]